MHNGAVSDFLTIKRELCALMSDASYAQIQGGTDSEHLAALYMTYLTQYQANTDIDAFQQIYPLKDMLSALQNTISTVMTLQQRTQGSDRQPNSLNLCATDGVKLVATRFRNAIAEQPPSLYYSTTAGRVLNSKFPDHPNASERTAGGQAGIEHGRHFIVASEPSTYVEGEWEVVGKNCWVGCTSEGGVVGGRMEVVGLGEQEVGTVKDWEGWVPPISETAQGNEWVWEAREGKYVCLEVEGQGE